MLPVGRITDNPSVPFAGAETYLPDQLIAGNAKLVTQAVVVTGGVNLSRGTVLGLVRGGSSGLIGSPVAVSGNHGNGTIGAITFGQQAKTGIYAIEFITATTYNVIDPNGAQLVSAGGNNWGPDPQVMEIGFTFTAGTVAMTSGDEIQIIAAPSAAGAYKMARPEATDGSQEPCAILVDQANAATGDVSAGVYLTGEFNGRALIYDAAFTVQQLTALLRKWNIHVKTQVNALDPLSNTGGAMGTDAGGTLV